MAGIRSTGATAAMGIAEHVQDLLQKNLHQPSSLLPPAANALGFNWSKTSKDSMTADGVEYTVTHPITKFGLFHESKQPAAKL